MKTPFAVGVGSLNFAQPSFLVMASTMTPSEQLDQPYERWLSYYARFGYAAKGIVYGSSGVLATLAFELSDNDTVGLNAVNGKGN